jgi:hypothetical protein
MENNFSPLRITRIQSRNQEGRSTTQHLSQNLLRENIRTLRKQVN